MLLEFRIFFFKQKTAYEIKECDWSSDVCSSDLYLGKELDRCNYGKYSDHQVCLPQIGQDDPGDSLPEAGAINNGRFNYRYGNGLDT